MRKILFILLCIIPIGIWAQDSKVSDLAATTSPDSADIFYIVEGGTSKKILWYYMAQTGFPVDVRTNAAGQVLFESLWLGEDAGINHTAGAFYNFGVGSRAHYALTSGVGNTALGYNSGFSLTTGSGNDFVGLQSGYGIDTASFNLSQGYKNMYAANGRGNISRGYEAAYNLTGKHNIFDGWQSGRTATTADYNVGLGYKSLYSLTTGDYNVGVGYNAGFANTSTGSTFIGAYAGDANTTGVNIAVGYQALSAETGGTGNTIIGYQSALVADGANSTTTLGYLAGTAITTGDYNTLVGRSTGASLTTQAFNVGLGYMSLGTSTGASSVGIGSNTGLVNESTGSVFIGHQAGQANTTGVNLAIGYRAMNAEDVGSDNTIIGYQAALVADGIYGTTIVGRESGKSLSTGDYNSFYGYSSGESVSSGSNNTFLGYQSGSAQNVSGSIKIGFQAGTNDANSNTLFISNSSDASPLIYGDFSVDSLVVHGDLTIRDDQDGKGAYYYADYSAVGTDRWLTDKEYGDTHLGGQDLNSTVYAPEAADHEGVITYDSTGRATGADFYKLTDVVSVESAAGMMIVAFDTILYTDDASQENIVQLPLGAVVWDIQIHVYTEFDGGGTNLLDIGITGNGDHYTNDLDVGVSTAWPTMTLLNIPSRFSAEDYVTWQYDDSDNDATQGMAFIYVRYSIH